MRRAFTLIELMIALFLSSLVIGSILMVFNYQHSAWLHRTEEGESRLLLQGVGHEFSRTLRSTGSYLPPGFGGLAIFQSDPSHLKIALNPSGARRIAQATASSRKSDASISVIVDSVAGFRENGYAIATVMVPVKNDPGNPPIMRPAPYALVALPILSISSTTPPTLKLGVDSLLAWGKWSWEGAIQIGSASTIYPLDTIEYWQSGDSLMRRVSRNAQGPLCDLVDSVRIEYLQPTGWSARVDAIQNPQTKITAIRVSTWVRSREPDPQSGKRSSDGFAHYNANAEFTFRNADILVNQVLP